MGKQAHGKAARELVMLKLLAHARSIFLSVRAWRMGKDDDEGCLVVRKVILIIWRYLELFELVEARQASWHLSRQSVVA